MYAVLEERFESIGYKKCALIKGESVESGEQGTFNGYISFDLSHLSNAGIDLTNIKATIITNNLVVTDGDLVEINHRYILVKQVLCYRNPFAEDYNTFEILT